MSHKSLEELVAIHASLVERRSREALELRGAYDRTRIESLAALQLCIQAFEAVIAEKRALLAS